MSREMMTCSGHSQHALSETMYSSLTSMCYAALLTYICRSGSNEVLSPQHPSAHLHTHTLTNHISGTH